MFNESKKRLNILVIAVLIMLYLTPLSLTYAIDGETDGNKDIPGLPDDALQYNRTDITPYCQMEQITSREMYLFCYRTLTLALNCTRNCYLNITTDSAVRKRLLALSIDPNQTMTLNINMTVSPPAGETVMERNLNFYLGLEPNATLQLSAQIRLHINETKLNQELNRVINASRLTWMYWNRTKLEWIPVPSYMDQNGYLVCNTNHFSTWTVAEIAPENSTSTQWDWTTYTIIGLVAAAIIALVVIVIRKR